MGRLDPLRAVCSCVQPPIVRNGKDNVRRCRLRVNTIQWTQTQKGCEQKDGKLLAAVVLHRNQGLFYVSMLDLLVYSKRHDDITAEA